MQPCPIGMKSQCCKNCLMGPCRLINRNDTGVCGANQDVVSARNILRFTAGGTAAHTGHALHMLNFLKKRFPKAYIEKNAPRYLIELWQQLGLMPRIKYEHFKDISEALHASTFGVNADYQELLKMAVRLGIIDGYLGLKLATELEDKEYGKPKIQKGRLDLGTIRKEKVNIAVHGHEPMLAEALVKEARRHKNISLIGVCCTGASLLSRYGIPLAGNVVLQEQIISSGMIDAIAVDLQCVMPSLADLCECFHTKFITTNPLARIPNALHLPVTNKKSAKQAAKKIIEIAIKNKRNRKNALPIGKSMKKTGAIVGFDETISDKLAEQLRSEEIKGIIAVIGCRNPRVKIEPWLSIYKRLSRKYAILTTGCVGFEFGKAGMLDGKRFFHLGSCINNSRVAEIFRRIADKNKKRITEKPFLISAPAPLAEKCIAIGFFFAALGVDVHFGYPMLIKANSNVENFLASVLKRHFHSRIFLEENPGRLFKVLNKGLLS